MRKNVFWPISLLLMILFLFPSCSSSKKVYSHKTTSRVEPIRIDSENKIRKAIVKDAQSFLGTKYQYGGKSPNAFDCSGLTSYVMKRNGIKIPSGSSYQAILGKRVKPNQSKPGDLIFFGKKGNVNHVGIVVENSKDGIYVIHSTTSKGVVIDNIKRSKYWNDRLLFSRNLFD